MEDVTVFRDILRPGNISFAKQTVEVQHLVFQSCNRVWKMKNSLEFSKLKWKEIKTTLIIYLFERIEKRHINLILLRQLFQMQYGF